LLSATCVFGAPVDDVQAIDPFFNAERDVRFLLSTRQNRNSPQQLTFGNVQSVLNSHFDRSRPTRILIHGWFEDDTSDISTLTSAELLDYYDFNVIFVDWSEGSRTINYIGAANRVPGIGQLVGAFLDMLHANSLIQTARTSVIGFSLGAHIAGHTGKNTRNFRINNIVGLDPAGPLFSVRNPEGRIDASDATYVECIHTNGPTIILVGAGIGAPIGHADFFPNGGDSQPGCLTNTCSHGRAVDYYVESVASNAFFAWRCPERDSVSSRLCTLTPGAWMGGDHLNFDKRESGSFYLETNRRSPFAEGPVRA